MMDRLRNYGSPIRTWLDIARSNPARQATLFQTGTYGIGIFSIFKGITDKNVMHHVC
jgi:hypothetical protein